MFANDDFIKCQMCTSIYSLPKILPCGETVCLKCVPETNEGSFECIFCNESHVIPKNGFVTNKVAQEAINKACQALNEDPSYKKYASLLDRTEAQFGDFKTYFKTSESDVIEYCRSLINEIDLLTEQKISQINDQRDKLIEQINEYEISAIQNLKNYRERYDSFCKEIDECLEARNKNEVEILRDRDLIIKGIDKCCTIESKMTIESARLDFEIYEFKSQKFLPNIESIQNNFLGRLSLECLKSKSKMEPLLNFTGQISDSKYKITRAKNGKFVFIYKKQPEETRRGFNRSVYQREFDREFEGDYDRNFNSKKLYEDLEIKSCLNSSWNQKVINQYQNPNTILEYGIETNENNIYLYLNYSNKNFELRHYDVNLNAVASKRVVYEISSIFVTQENVFAKCKTEFNQFILYCFDKKLEN